MITRYFNTFLLQHRTTTMLSVTPSSRRETGIYPKTELGLSIWAAHCLLGFASHFLIRVTSIERSVLYERIQKECAENQVPEDHAIIPSVNYSLRALAVH
jgi:hypothetical protein